MTPRFASIVCLVFSAAFSPACQADMEWVRISADSKGFVLEKSGNPFKPWGVNYDHDESGRLIEDYWLAEWAKVEEDFSEMKALGANVVRVHLQVAKFMDSPDKPNGQSLDQLSRLVALAEKTGLYLDVTGLGCYHKQDVPEWYDKLNEKARWEVQARFWEAVAARCSGSPAIFCYDLMNEPVSPAGPKGNDWLGPAFGDKHFVQRISLDLAGRDRAGVAREWTRTLVAAIRKHDKKHLVTVGMVDWSLDRPGLTSGFVPAVIAPELDFVSVHIYPKSGKLKEALETLKGFNVGKPVVVEEIFSLECSTKELGQFMEMAGDHAAGWIGFYWGKTIEECRASKTITDAIVRDWLEFFQARSKQLNR